MSKSPLSVLVRNLFWIIPLFITISLWEFTSPVILQLVLAYIGMIVLNPMVNWIESIIQKRGWSVFMVMVSFLIFWIILFQTIFPILSHQAKEFQTLLTMDTFLHLRQKIEVISKDLLPVFIYEQVNSLLISLDDAFP